MYEARSGMIESCSNCSFLKRNPREDIEFPPLKHRRFSDPGTSSQSETLIDAIGRDMSINCILKCPRAYYGSIASLSKGFQFLIRSGEVYKLRRMKRIIEHWVYFSCQLLQWEAFDPTTQRWLSLPEMTCNECFKFSDKESLCVGTELLVFGKEVASHVIYKYSILTNSWSRGKQMTTPRCLFGSASSGEIAILAGGCDPLRRTLGTVEMYNSETHTWTELPPMNTPRKMCSAVFMDGKFYVIGGIGGSDNKVLSCGEEYDMVLEKWTEIPNMSPGRGDMGEAPPLLAVVANELYAAVYGEMEVKKYDKKERKWKTIGRLPEGTMSMNGWGVAFRGCGGRLVVIGGPRSSGEGFIEVNGWVPDEESPKWVLLARKQSGNFVYNCAIMGC